MKAMATDDIAKGNGDASDIVFCPCWVSSWSYSLEFDFQAPALAVVNYVLCRASVLCVYISVF